MISVSNFLLVNLYILFIIFFNQIMALEFPAALVYPLQLHGIVKDFHFAGEAVPDRVPITVTALAPVPHPAGTHPPPPRTPPPSWPWFVFILPKRTFNTFARLLRAPGTRLSVSTIGDGIARPEPPQILHISPTIICPCQVQLATSAAL